jgi:ferric-dicitrate binding protein FerR (iron transport regulator)
MNEPMPEIACRRVREWFLDLEDARLLPEREEALCAHLEVCPTCRTEWAAWQAEGKELRDALRPMAAPRDLAAAAAAQLRSRPVRPIEDPVWPQAVKWGLAAAAALLVVLLGQMIGPAIFRTSPYVRLGQFGSLVGRPLAAQRGARFASAVMDGAEVFDGALLMTGKGEQLEVHLADGSLLMLNAGTEARLSGGGLPSECGDTLPHVCLHRGDLLCHFAGNRRFRAVGTPLGSVFFDGAAEFRIRYEPGVATRVEVVSGEVEFTGSEGMVRVGAGGQWAVDGVEGVPHQQQQE